MKPAMLNCTRTPTIVYSLLFLVSLGVGCSSDSDPKMKNLETELSQSRTDLAKANSQIATLQERVTSLEAAANTERDLRDFGPANLRTKVTKGMTKELALATLKADGSNLNGGVVTSSDDLRFLGRIPWQLANGESDLASNF